MGENKVTSKFLEAIRTGELAEFALGLGKYFIRDREHGDHWVLNSWQRDIVPALDQIAEEELNVHLQEMLWAIMHNAEIPLETRLKSLLYHLSVFYYLKQEGRFSSDAFGNSNKDIMNWIRTAAESEPKIKDQVSYAINLIQKRGGLHGFRIP